MYFSMRFSDYIGTRARICILASGRENKAVRRMDSQYALTFHICLRARVLINR